MLTQLFGVLNLDFEIYLGFGACDLGFPRMAGIAKDFGLSEILYAK